MERYTSVEPIPIWALCYIVNGDASGLTGEEISMIDDYMQYNNIEIINPREGEYFSYYPAFGAASEVVDCDVLYYN